MHNSKKLSKSAIHRPLPIPSNTHSLYEENGPILTNELNNQPNTWPYHIVQATSRQLFTVEALVQYQSVLWKLWQIRWPVCGLTNMGLSLTPLLQLQQDCKWCNRWRSTWTLPWCSSLSKRTLSWYTRKCNCTNGHKKLRAFRAPSFTKLSCLTTSSAEGLSKTLPITDNTSGKNGHTYIYPPPPRK